MVCTVLPLSACAAPHVRSSFTTLLVRADGAGTVVDLWGEVDLSTGAAGEAVIEVAGTEFVDMAIVRAVPGRQQLLAGRARQLTFSPSRLAVRVLHLFGPTELIEAREGVQL